MSDPKRIKLDSSGNGKWKKGKDGKRNYYAKAGENGGGKPARERYLKPGHRGFLITCNGRVRDCVRDSYRILNEYADEFYGPQEQAKETEDGKQVAAATEAEEQEEEDISIKLQKEAEAAGQKSDKAFRFQNVDSGATNCLFIQTSLENPNEIGYKLMKDLSATKKHKSRFILRMLPIEAVCRANLKDIMDTVGALCDRYFLKEPKSYAIIFHRRLNNELSRDDVIRELADLITAKNAGNKANLKNPDLAVIVEVIKGLCCIGILQEYYQLRKYNLAEIVAQTQAPPPTEAGPARTEDSENEQKVDEEAASTASKEPKAEDSSRSADILE
ncbi:THUMP domain-containing protein 1 homolog [Anopheles ziemanni]|uniref:THUMP domain-containing protein 1 homolog n=1 Tax=Anopheles coustani TaxID=139045 RepID=UPI0026590504|nr:THUMP domain-containing protein 1 homolog [Anopheles coustani]XP_058167686.1 THUMP domain-containing protein 1 homolog [Anopheles ziemanni]